MILGSKNFRYFTPLEADLILISFCKMWSIHFYNAAEKNDNSQKVKLYSAASTDSSSQLSQDGGKVNHKGLEDTREEEENLPEEENGRLNISSEKEATLNEVEVSPQSLDRSSSAGSNKTMDSFIMVDHRDAQEGPAPRKGTFRFLHLFVSL